MPYIKPTTARANKRGTTDFMSVQLAQFKILPMLVSLIFLQTSTAVVTVLVESINYFVVLLISSTDF
jgi:predicted class III extradiol MEMO1 family dioxygenase